MTTVAILEDSPLPLAQMQQALILDPSFEVLFTCAKGADMQAWLTQNPVDVLVADLGLPDISGVQVVEHCVKVRERTEIMVCTVFEDDEHLFKSLQAGANAYLLKSDIVDKFLPALAELIQGGSPMSSSIARRVLGLLHLPSATQAPTSTNESLPELTPKELDVLNLLMRGFKYAEIGRTLSCSTSTINTHIKSIYRKLQVSSKTEAVFEARSMNII